MTEVAIKEAAARLLDVCHARKLKLATAESCTGGLVAAALTAIPGSSSVFDRGFVTYSNRAKHELLGVSDDILARNGAVSRETAEAMVRGALGRADADLAVAVTGIAGPGGGSAEKPVGLVHFAAGARGGALVHAEKRFGGIGRGQIREVSVLQALAMLLNLTGN